jgi:hypothetical protein
MDKSDTVVLLDARLSAQLTSEYRKRELWAPIGDKDIREIAITAPDAKESITLKQGPTGWVDAAKPTEKLNKQAINEMVLVLGQLRVERFVVDKGADLKKFGLDKPRTLTVTTEEGKKTLLLGNLADGKRLYGKLDDPARTDVFEFSEFDTRALNQTRANFVEAPKESKKDEPKKDELKKGEPKKDEPKKETPKK